jgi:hypothetical protein
MIASYTRAGEVVVSDQPRWADAEQALAEVRQHTGEWNTLLLLARLPLLPTTVLERLDALNGPACVYRRLARLTDVGLVAGIRPPIRPGHSPRLLYLTDLGIATLALAHHIEPGWIARTQRLRGADLLALAPELPYLVACYELLGALADSGPGFPRLLAWEHPWRRRYQPLTAKGLASVRLPAYAAFDWGKATSEFALLPDTGAYPTRAYRPTLHQLFALRHIWGDLLPVLIVATIGTERAEAWQHLLDEVARSRWEPALEAVVVCWEDPYADLETAVDLAARHGWSADQLVPRRRPQRLATRRPAARLPRLVGDVLTASPARARAASGLSQVALGLSETDRSLLRLIGQHPFLPAAALAAVLGWQTSWARHRRNRLVAQGSLRFLEAHEVGATAAADELAELTTEGLALVAAEHGLTAAAAVEHLGLAGGGPGAAFGARRKLVANLAHTRGGDEVIVGLYRVARQPRGTGSDDAVQAWHNASMVARGRFRPDGYVRYEHADRLCGFLFEYDRGTMSRRGYLKKLAAYYDYLITGRYQADYIGFPTVLVVTTSNAAEARFAEAARAAAIGRPVVLPLLLTCTWRIEDARNPYGLLGPIWREPTAAFTERRPWLLHTAPGPDGRGHACAVCDQSKLSSSATVAELCRGNATSQGPVPRAVPGSSLRT